MPQPDGGECLIAMLKGVGIDIVEIERLRMSIERTGQAFLEKVYSADELCVLPAKNPRRTEFLAGRWAAKEAFAKALGCGITDRCRLNEITVLDDESGRPSMTLGGAAFETAKSLGVSQIHISISHEKAYATAVVILE